MTDNEVLLHLWREGVVTDEEIRQAVGLPATPKVEEPKAPGPKVGDIVTDADLDALPVGTRIQHGDWSPFKKLSDGTWWDDEERRAFAGSLLTLPRRIVSLPEAD